ncbi:unnamed protein product [Durusdinium trenchii]|uniref:Uncharacterized protein n=1 Tax=Durusdinium trenchii TaxID=1381693 RepID=A0ABP0LGU1_9DINO
MVARWRNIGFALALPVLPTCFAGKPDVQANHSRNATTKVDHKEERSCELLTDHHGSWKGSVKRGGIYVLTCDPGFAVDGKPTVNMTCNSDAEWPAKPWCEDIDDCALLLYGCGPAGLCKDLPQRAECICERGAYRDIATNGEVVCHFNKASDCGGRNCGSHGVCVHLKEYQNTFDTGNSSFRCSCEHGYMDDGESCVASDCGPLQDPFGKWSGSHAYLGEYTLECAEGAFVWGGTEQAMTISCPSYGRWHTVPRCLSPVEERRKAEEERMKVIFHVAASAVCILMAALAAGLTMGLVSLEPVELQIIEAARLDYCANSKERERLQRQKDAAKHILPLLKDHHLLLVTLLLLNALANEALPIFLDDLLSPVFAVLLSVTFVLVCGEILPSAVFTGPWQLTFSSWFVPVVRFLLCALYCIAKPIARILDKALKKDRFERFSRPEVRAVLRLHCASGSATSGGQTLSEGSGFSPFRSSAQAQPLCTEEDPPEMDPPVLDDEEVDLCLAMLNLGDTLVADSPGFYTLKQCARRVLPVEFYSSAVCVAADAVAANKDLVAVFPSLENVQWPIEVACEDITGLVKVSELLTAGVTQVGVLCRRKEVPRLEGFFRLPRLAAEAAQSPQTKEELRKAVLQICATGGGWPLQLQERLLQLLQTPCEARTCLFAPSPLAVEVDEGFTSPRALSSGWLHQVFLGMGALTRLPIFRARAELYRSQPASVVLSNSSITQKRDCFAFRGANASLALRLRSPSRVQQLVIEQPPRWAALRPTSLPRHFSVFGAGEVAGVQQYTEALGDFTYSSAGPAVQAFVLANTNVPLTGIRVAFAGPEWDHNYICLYRIKLFEGMETACSGGRPAWRLQDNSS